MAIEFREVRRGEIDDALTFAAAHGAAIEASALQPQLSLVAINQEQTTLGSALHHLDTDGRRHIAVHLDSNINPGLARLLIDRALRKAEAADLATAHVVIEHAAADADTWNGANWLSRLRPTAKAPANPNKSDKTDSVTEAALPKIDAPAEPKPTEAEGQAA